MDKFGQLNASQLQAAQEVSRQRLEKAAQEQTQKYQNVVETQRSAESSRIKSGADEGGGAGEALSRERAKSRTRQGASEDEPGEDTYEIRDPKLGRRIDVMG